MKIDDADRFGRSVWISLLWGLFALEGSNLGVGKAWISLDSLVLIVTYQWVPPDFRAKFFASAFSGEAWREDRRGAVEAVRRGRIMHEIELSLNSAFPQSIVQIERCLRRNPKAARPKSAG